MNPFQSQDSNPSHSNFKTSRLNLLPCASLHRVAGWPYRMATVREEDQVNSRWEDRVLKRKSKWGIGRQSPFLTPRVKTEEIEVAVKGQSEEVTSQDHDV